MPKLQYSDIKYLVDSAKSLGLPKVSIDAIREALIVQNAELTPDQRLGVELLQAPKSTQENIKAFATGYTSISDSIDARGQAGLESISDEEWQKIIGGASE